MSRPDIFYQPPKGESSGLPHDPFKSFVIPRPIGWISTTSKSGQDNLAPFSQFNNVSFDPTTIMFIGHQSVYKRQNPSYDLRDSVNATALESWDDEFPLTKVTKVPSKVVNPPRVAESPAQFECKVHSILRINGDSLLFDVLKAAPLAKLGYHQYTAINNIFNMDMPFMPDDHVSGNTLGGVVPKDVDEDNVMKNGSEVEKRGSFTAEIH
ncbi:hypothetical protein BofuT4_P139420.1 [Botrytis cinerea T4]|uniref:Flavin reductase like domain-containing protein n=1 Tax=Botryotinia fuckeliana (strain T4) TaxID=999810 RepID=G2YN20_BOTF4|nr:hypothetical protein BofuT4_P139420.1 [Botrytis cinerea T4]